MDAYDRAREAYEAADDARHALAGKPRTVGRFTFGTIFSGGGMAALGLQQAGGTPLFAIDSDPATCAAYAANLGAHIRCQSVQDVDPATLPLVDMLQASPSCRMFSQARSKTLTMDEDDAGMGAALIPILDVLRPRVFLLENVSMYRHSAVFVEIVAALWRLGYMVQWDLLNSADWGVPQTRIRLILRAVRGGLLPPFPPPTQHLGWYQAIEDLIPTLPDSAFAEWQKVRLRDHDWAAPFLQMTGNTQMACPTGTGIVPVGAPANTVTPGSNAARAYLVDCVNQRAMPIRESGPPALTVTGTHGLPRAYLVSGTDATTRHGDEPAHTLTATLDKHTASPRAYLVDGQNTNRAISIRDADSPALTVGALRKTADAPRAFIVDCTTGRRGGDAGNRMLTTRDQEDPMFTVTAGANRRPIRAGVPEGRVVSMTPRALARFQTIPDSYILPDRRADALRIIGNAVPPEMMRRLILPLIGD